MSITLMAYPMAFLVAPENVKDDGLQRASDKNSSINKALESITVIAASSANSFMCFSIAFGVKS